MAFQYLFDTHALIFWSLGKEVSQEFIDYFDEQVEEDNVLVSSVSFWEAALLSKKAKIDIPDIELWKNELCDNSNIHVIDPIASEMIASVNLPDIHKDPFDRILIVQANRYHVKLVTKDVTIPCYSVKTFWI